MFDEDSRLTKFFSGFQANLKEILVGVVLGISLILIVLVFVEPWVIISIINTILLAFLYFKVSPAPKHKENRETANPGKKRGRPKGSKNKPKEAKT